MKTFKKFINETKVIRRNLPINTTYKLIDSYYTGGIIDNPESCENCGKLIANVGIIQNSDGDKFHVGMDCASTLSNIKNSSEYDETMNNFNEATSIRTKIRINQKKYPNAKLSVENNHSGNVNIELSEKGDWSSIFRISHSCKFIDKYLPEISKLIKNKNKNGFVPKYSESTDFNFDFNKITPPKQHGNNYNFKIDNYDIIIKDIISIAPNGNKNDIIGIIINKNGEILSEESTYMTKNIKTYLISALNKIEFDKFNNL